MKWSNCFKNVLNLVFAVVLATGIWITNPVFAQNSSAANSHHTKHFVLVHGAWHGSWVWYKVVPILEAGGHQVTLVNLPAHGIDLASPGSVSLEDYTERVTEVLDTITTPVILVGHSMGGIVISTAAEARPNKIEKLVYLAGFLVRNGESMIQWAAQDAGSITGQNLIVDPVAGTIDVDRSVVADAFYNTSLPRDITLGSTLLRINPLAPIVTNLSLSSENYGSVRRFYIKTEQDFAITPWLQNEMLLASPCEGVYSINGDHSPFFSRPLNLVALLLLIAYQ